MKKAGKVRVTCLLAERPSDPTGVVLDPVKRIEIDLTNEVVRKRLVNRLKIANSTELAREPTEEQLVVHLEAKFIDCLLETGLIEEPGLLYIYSPKLLAKQYGANAEQATRAHSKAWNLVSALVNN